MSEKSGAGNGGLAKNLLWLLALVILVTASIILWFGGDRLIIPSRETAVVRVFRKARPAVVNLSAQPLDDRSSLGFGEMARIPRLQEFLKSLYGDLGQEKKLNLGSGIIVDPRGFILTNEHVVSNTAWIQVMLADGSTVFGEVWGTEPSLDLAVVKVDVDRDLPYLSVGSSRDIMIGEQIVVIGNPFGLGHTCTTGIISALHRPVKFGNRVYRDLVQIDAAVNPGNSGGPLLNVRGELIGITTAINPEAEGIGFAIPSDFAARAVEDLIQYRYVPTGWLGVSVDEVGGGIFGSGGGVFVTRVESDGPSQGELSVGDVILSWNDYPVAAVQDFVTLARKLRAGDEVEFTIRRDGREKSVEIDAEAFPELLAEAWAANHLGIRVESTESPFISPRGAMVVRKGVAISEVMPGGPAQSHGLSAGDLILRLNREEVRDLTDFRKAVVMTRSRENIFIPVQRGRWTFFVTLPLSGGGERW